MCMHMHVHVHVVPAAYICTRKGHWAAQRVLTHHSTPRRPTNLPCCKHTHRVSAVPMFFLQVRSMYSHCQAPTGYQRRQSELSGKSHPDISLVDWLTLYVNTSSAWEQSARRCSFNPVNFQTHILAAPNGDVQSVGRERRSRSWKAKSVFHDRSNFVFPQGRFLVPAHVLDRLHSLIQTAFFVGVTE